MYPTVSAAYLVMTVSRKDGYSSACIGLMEIISIASAWLFDQKGIRKKIFAE